MGVCRHRVNAPRYGVDTTKRSIHIKLEKGSTAADQKWKTRRKTTNYINYVKKKNNPLPFTSEHHCNTLTQRIKKEHALKSACVFFCSALSSLSRWRKCF